jgi:hypothetical protein
MTSNPRRFIAALIALGAAQACDASDQSAQKHEGVYGASSGPNPNLADLQQDQSTTATTTPSEQPATADDNTYPSQTGAAPPPTTGEGERGSAQTGATDDGAD